MKAPKTNALVPDLVGFSLYHFYLLIRYAEKNTDTYGIYSEATQRTVRTHVSGKLHCTEHCDHGVSSKSLKVSFVDVGDCTVKLTFRLQI